MTQHRNIPPEEQKVLAMLCGLILAHLAVLEELVQPLQAIQRVPPLGSERIPVWTTVVTGVRTKARTVLSKRFDPSTQRSEANVNLPNSAWSSETLPDPGSADKRQHPVSAATVREDAALIRSDDVDEACDVLIEDGAGRPPFFTHHVLELLGKAYIDRIASSNHPPTASPGPA